jgi:dTDP-4-amino-4,6-dideoxygalactose transaminase
MDVKLAQEELRGQIAAVVARVLASGVYILGPELASFEKDFAAFHGVQHCLGTGTGYDALHLILRAMNIGPGDEVIVPANCFVSLWFGVSSVGATPVPVDADEKTFNVDPGLIAKALTPRTKAILVHHLYGQPADLAPILDIARGAKIKVVEEVTQAHGAHYRQRRAGSWGDAAAFDFYPTLNLGAVGDGGAILTNDLALADRMRSLRNFGAVGKQFGVEKGITSRLGELQAAVLRVKLNRLDSWNEIRRKQAAVLLKTLEHTPGIVLPHVLLHEGSDHVWHRFVIRHPLRDDIAKALLAAGIQTMVHYAEPPHLSAAYAELGKGPGSFPVTEKLCKEVLTLPIGPHLTIPQILLVAEGVDREARLRMRHAASPHIAGAPAPAIPQQELPGPALNLGVPLPKMQPHTPSDPENPSNLW